VTGLRRGGRSLSPRKVLAGLVMLVPGPLVTYFGFEDGGFYPTPQAYVGVLLAVLVAATTVIDRRGDLRRNRPLQLVTLVFSAYAAWILVSVAWSHAPLRAVSEFDLTLLYLLSLVLYGSSVTSPRRLRWLVRSLAVGAFLVCLAGLLSRTLPDLYSIPAGLETQRLNYPVTYWNALGLLASLGMILCLGLTSDDREPWLVKGLSAFAVPVFAATLLLTFSRGAIAAGIVGIVVYVVLARSRSLFGGLLAVAPTAAVALHAAYDATALAEPTYASAAAIPQGHELAVVVGACSLAAAVVRWLMIPADRLLIASTWRIPLDKPARRATGAVAVVLACLVALAAGLPHRLTTEYHDFVTGDALPGVAQVRDRLTEPGADGRIAIWRVAMRAFDTQPLHGTGAGTFPLVWETHRPAGYQIVNAHSLYIENLSNLGIVGLGLLVCVLLLGFVGIARRLRGPDRALYATGFAVALTWAVHAGVDWDWQMPVVSLPAFMLAGAAFARRRPSSAAPMPATPGGAAGQRSATGGSLARWRSAVGGSLASRRSVVGGSLARWRSAVGGSLAGWRSAVGGWRWLFAVAALAVGVVPALTAISQHDLQASVQAFEANDCPTAVSDAHAALSALPFRPDAHEILAYCALAAGNRTAALSDITQAVGEDPSDWEPHEGLSIIQGAIGEDPRREMATAVALDPFNILTTLYTGYFRYGLHPYWSQEAALDLLQVTGVYDDRNLAELRAGLRSRARRS
jgi:O-antigen ligase